MSIKIEVTHYSYETHEDFLHDLELLHNYWIPNQEAFDRWRTLFVVFGNVEVKEI